MSTAEPDKSRVPEIKPLPVLPHGRQPDDLTGRQFGQWEVLGFAFVKYYGPKRYPSYHWWCRCTCGECRPVSRQSLVEGTKGKGRGSTSCGGPKHPRQAGRPWRGHCVRVPPTLAEANHLEYRAWRALLRACYDRQDANYHLIGAKGGLVCDRWRTSFENFLADMLSEVGPRKSRKYALARQDGTKAFAPGNCHWVYVGQVV